MVFVFIFSLFVAGAGGAFPHFKQSVGFSLAPSHGVGGCWKKLMGASAVPPSLAGRQAALASPSLLGPLPRSAAHVGSSHGVRPTTLSWRCALFTVGFLKILLYGHRQGREYQPAHTTTHTNTVFPQGWLNQQGGEPWSSVCTNLWSLPWKSL